MAKDDNESNPAPPPVTVDYTKSLQEAKPASKFTRVWARVGSIIAFAGGASLIINGVGGMFASREQVTRYLHSHGYNPTHDQTNIVTATTRVLGGILSSIGITSVFSGFSIWKTANDSKKLSKLKDDLNTQIAYSKER